MASWDYFKPAIAYVGAVHCQEDCEMFDVLDVRIRCAVNVRRESSRAGKLIIDCDQIARSAKVLAKK